MALGRGAPARAVAAPWRWYHALGGVPAAQAVACECARPRCVPDRRRRNRSLRIPVFAGVTEDTRSATRRFSLDEPEPMRREPVLVVAREPSRTRDQRA